MKVLDYRKTMQSKLVLAIVAAGYTPGGSTGRAENQSFLQESKIGAAISILHQDPRDHPTRVLFFKRKTPRRLIATIFVDDDLRDATDKSWVVETTWREDLDEIAHLVKGLAKQLGAKIGHISITSDTGAYENDYSDY